VVYNVYRSEAPGFTPGPATLVAACVSGTTFVDSAVASGTEYFYVVRAEDNSGTGSGPCAGGNEEVNAVELSAFPSGHSALFFYDDMESGTGRWSTAGSGGVPWSLVTTSSHSPTRSWFVPDTSTITDQQLEMSTALDLVAAPSARLSFWHRYSLEFAFDGGVLEYSTDDGATWFDILDGNGASIPYNWRRFVRGGYIYKVSARTGNPIGGRGGWTGNEMGWEEVVVDLGDFYGETVHFRWRFGADVWASDVGWWIDDVEVWQSSPCFPPFPCEDGVDNDRDGAIDFPDDSGCLGLTDFSEHANCRDGFDNDDDGDLDFPDDRGCRDHFWATENPECQDGISNDDDGLVDMADPGCANPFGITESPECNDGIDNDGDTLIDLADPSCRFTWGDDETQVYAIVCGLGAELALMLAPLVWLAGRRK
jgi:hypothetical protein